jgi:hypothetical protein
MATPSLVQRGLNPNVNRAGKRSIATTPLRRALAKSLDYFHDEPDDAKSGMMAAYATGDYTMQAIADAFDVHSSTVSQTVNGQ